jgi:hypothetical protein
MFRLGFCLICTFPRKIFDTTPSTSASLGTYCPRWKRHTPTRVLCCGMAFTYYHENSDPPRTCTHYFHLYHGRTYSGTGDQLCGLIYRKSSERTHLPKHHVPCALCIASSPCSAWSGCMHTPRSVHITTRLRYDVIQRITKFGRREEAIAYKPGHE